ncbi:MAG: hypothetical protein IPK82_21705 [Polyangiaceae bacterium]|nr:hypothetical protein [Polyangiaceae bacterium]
MGRCHSGFERATRFAIRLQAIYPWRERSHHARDNHLTHYLTPTHLPIPH